MGAIEVPADKYWGAQTQRSIENFKIGDGQMPIEIIRAFAILKKAAALTNAELGVIAQEKADLIAKVCDEILEGKLDEHQSRMFEDDRPAEELYDLRNDPHEIHNLVHDPAYAYELARHRMMLAEWMVRTDDKGQYPESLRELRGIVRRVGEQAVNPEYDAVR